MRQFALALKADPSWAAAQWWVDDLQTPAAEAPMPQPATAGGATVNTRRAMPSDDALLSSEKPSPQRLPPVALRHPPSEGATLPGISYDRPADSAAPLPPPLINYPVRPQPSSP